MNYLKSIILNAVILTHIITLGTGQQEITQKAAQIALVKQAQTEPELKKIDEFWIQQKKFFLKTYFNNNKNRILEQPNPNLYLDEINEEIKKTQKGLYQRFAHAGFKEVVTNEDLMNLFIENKISPGKISLAESEELLTDFEKAKQIKKIFINNYFKQNPLKTSFSLDNLIKNINENFFPSLNSQDLAIYVKVFRTQGITLTDLLQSGQGQTIKPYIQKNIYEFIENLLIRHTISEMVLPQKSYFINQKIQESPEIQNQVVALFNKSTLSTRELLGIYKSIQQKYQGIRNQFLQNFLKQHYDEISKENIPLVIKNAELALQKENELYQRLALFNLAIISDDLIKSLASVNQQYYEPRYYTSPNR
jgi:hypothetical protein